ncbi:MAG: TusE/DsrC/DsvC family sulfur relay protein [Pseudomonadota bacterium]|nr:TusE/DsrC/DsvC family sulfur relay protein [Pseudomonadota bacterium]
MTAMQIAGRALEFNPKGYLVNFDDWNREVGEALAQEEGLQLSDCHWRVIGFLRDYYGEYEHPPSPRLIIKGIGEKLTMNAPCTRKTLEALFPVGGCKQACRIAGLPDFYCHSC